MSCRSLPWLLATLPLLALTAPASAGELTIDQERSIFAVITHKGGLASGLAHNHLIAAAGYQARLALDPGAPLEASFEITLPSAELAVDASALQNEWYPRISELGVLDDPFSELSDKDRGKIRDAMLGKSQLNVKQHAEIRAELVALEERPSEIAGTTFPYSATLALEVVGQRVEKPVAVRLENKDGKVALEALGTYAFSDFGIEAYSALFGSIKNLDEFHVFVHLIAE